MSLPGCGSSGLCLSGLCLSRLYPCTLHCFGQQDGWTRTQYHGKVWHCSQGSCGESETWKSHYDHQPCSIHPWIKKGWYLIMSVRIWMMDVHQEVVVKIKRETIENIKDELTDTSKKYIKKKVLEEVTKMNKNATDEINKNIQRWSHRTCRDRDQGIPKEDMDDLFREINNFDHFEDKKVDKKFKISKRKWEILTQRIPLKRQEIYQS